MAFDARKMGAVPADEEEQSENSGEEFDARELGAIPESEASQESPKLGLKGNRPSNDSEKPKSSQQPDPTDSEYYHRDYSDEQLDAMRGGDADSRDAGTFLKDAGASLMEGFARTGESLLEVNDAINPGQNAYEAVVDRMAENPDEFQLEDEARELFSNATEYWRDAKSPELQAQKKAVQEADGFLGTLDSAGRNPGVIWDTMIQQVPMLMTQVGASGKVAQTVAAKAGQSAAQKAAAATATATEGAQAGGHAGLEARETINSMKLETLRKDETFQELESEYGPEKARNILADRTARGATLLAGGTTALLSKWLGDGSRVAEAVAGKNAGARGMLGRIGMETASESIQEAGEGAATDLVTSQVDPRIDPLDPNQRGKEAAMGLLAGAGQAAGVEGVRAAGSGIRSRVRDKSGDSGTEDSAPTMDEAINPLYDQERAEKSDSASQGGRYAQGGQPAQADTAAPDLAGNNDIPVDDQPSAGGTEQADSASVPTMITRRMRDQLKEKGFTENDIRQMRPQEAWNRIQAGEGPTSAQPEQEQDPERKVFESLLKQFDRESPGNPNVVDPRRDDILTAVAKEGGLEPSDLGGEIDTRAARDKQRVGRPIVRRQGEGRSMDDMAERLNQEGFRDPQGQELTPDTLAQQINDAAALGETIVSQASERETMIDPDNQVARDYFGGDRKRLRRALEKRAAGEPLTANQQDAVDELADRAMISDERFEAGDQDASEAVQAQARQDVAASAERDPDSLDDAEESAENLANFSPSGYDDSQGQPAQGLDQAVLDQSLAAVEAGVSRDQVREIIERNRDRPASALGELQAAMPDQQGRGQEPEQPVSEWEYEQISGTRALEPGEVPPAPPDVEPGEPDGAAGPDGRAQGARGAQAEPEPAQGRGEEAAPSQEQEPGRLRGPDELLRQQLEDQGVLQGLSQDRANRIVEAFAASRTDSVTGWADARAGNIKKDAATEAQRAQQASGDPAHYVSMDIENLGGLNAFHNDVASQANQDIRAMTDIVREELSALGPTFFMRTGGDEIGVFIQGPAASEINAAMESARARIEQYGRQQGFADIPHAKGKDTKGVNIQFSPAEVRIGEQAVAVYDRADEALKQKEGEDGGQEAAGPESALERDSAPESGETGGSAVSGVSGERAAGAADQQSGGPQDGQSDQRSDVVLKPNGTPYETRNAAQVAITGRGLQGYTPVEVEGGWGLAPEQSDLLGNTPEQTRAQELENERQRRRQQRDQQADQAERTSDGPLFDDSQQQQDVEGETGSEPADGNLETPFTTKSRDSFTIDVPEVGRITADVEHRGLQSEITGVDASNRRTDRHIFYIDYEGARDGFVTLETESNPGIMSRGEVKDMVRQRLQSAIAETDQAQQQRQQQTQSAEQRAQTDQEIKAEMAALDQGQPGSGQAQTAIDLVPKDQKDGFPQFLANLSINPETSNFQRTALQRDDWLQAAQEPWLDQPFKPGQEGDGGARWTAEWLIQNLRDAEENVRSLDGRLRSSRNRTASESDLLDAWIKQEQLRNELERSREQYPAEWQAYDQRQEALQELSKGDRVRTPIPSPEEPYGVTGTIERKGSKNWRVDRGNGNSSLIPKEALAPANAPAHTQDLDGRVEQAASEAATSPENDRAEPTDGQKEAGNYKKGAYAWKGLRLTIKNPRGSTREGTDPDGNRWQTEMAHHYGDISQTEGADGDAVDVFMGPNPESEQVFIIDQVDPQTGRFDEHKVMLGFDGQREAVDGYLANYEQNWGGLGAITAMPLDDFKTWLASGNTGTAVAAALRGSSQGQQAEAGTDPSTQGQTGEITDFGEKIAGARKDYAQKLADAAQKDTASVPLSQSWPEPNYKKMLDNGSDPRAVAMARAMRDQIGTKPQKRGLRRWAEQVEQLRSFAERLMSGEIDTDYVESKLEEKSSLKPVARRADLYEAVGHEKSLKGINLVEGEFTVFEGERYDPPLKQWVVEKKRSATALGNMPAIIARAKTKQEAIEQFREKLSSLDEERQSARRKIRFDVYSDRVTGDVFIGKKAGRDVVRVIEGFANGPEARKYLEENREIVERKFERMKDIPAHRSENNAPRVGVDYRNGQDVTPEMFEEAFGFRGVQFGNYVENTRRQQDLNETYDALMDMAGILNIPARALSLNGELGLAFGARGKGGKRAPAAHFEPDQMVINLTKAAGPGTLAHEWFHSLDNQIARRSSSDSNAYQTERLEDAGIRPEVAAAFKGIHQAINRTRLRQRAQKLDKTRTKPYWSEGREMAARAFESYIIEKLQDQGARNDYLANIVSQEYWEMREDLKAGQTDTYPYPEAAEVPEIRGAFDHLFQTLEAREDAQGNVELREGRRLYSGYDRNAGQVQDQRESDSGALPEPAQHDLFTPSSIPPETAATQSRDNFFVRYEQVETGQLNVGLTQIQSPEDAAHVVAPMRKHGDEAMTAVVTDENGHILNVVYHSKGTRDGASVFAPELASAIISTPGAAKVWLSHNHPSGNPKPSGADFTITDQIRNAFEGADVEIMGHVIVSPSGQSTLFSNKNVERGEYAEIEPTKAPRRTTASLTERKLRKRTKPGTTLETVGNPKEGMDLANELETENAIILLNTRHAPVGVVAMSVSEMKRLREGGRVQRLHRALDQTGANAVLIKTNDRDAAANLAGFFSNTGARVLDAFLENGTISAAEDAEADAVLNARHFESVGDEMPPQIDRRVMGDDDVVMGWTMLARNDDAFQLPYSEKKKSLPAMVKELTPQNKTEALDKDFAESLDADRGWALRTPDDKLAFVLERGSTVWISVSDLDPGDSGKEIYNLAANYAFNTGRVLMGDPLGLSDVAVTRRLENMLASALKFGTTGHLWPHDRQAGRTAAGDPLGMSLDWRDGDDAHNLRQMIDASYEATAAQFPKIRELRYNPEKDQFESAETGERWTDDDFEAEAAVRRQEAGAAPSVEGNPRGAGVRGPITAGRTSLKRAVLTGTLSRAESEGTRTAILARLGGQRSESLAGILYSEWQPGGDRRGAPAGNRQGVQEQDSQTLTPRGLGLSVNKVRAAIRNALGGLADQVQVVQSVSQIPARDRMESLAADGMYSAVKKAVQTMNLPQWKKDGGTARGADVWAKIKSSDGVKKEELEWLGLEDFLTADPQAQFSREDVVSFVAQNGVNVEEVVADQDVDDVTVNLEWNRAQTWDDPSAYQFRIDEAMAEFDAGRDVEEMGVFSEDFMENWVDEHPGEVVDNYLNSLPADKRKEIEDINDDNLMPEAKDEQQLKVVFRTIGEEQVRMDMRQEAREDFEEAVTRAVQDEYFEDPIVFMDGENHPFVIWGNDDTGYSVGEEINDTSPEVINVSSLNEAQIQAEEVARREGIIKEEDDKKVARHEQAVTEGPHENYRELKFTLPDIEGNFYKNAHFPDRNVLSFVRVTDRELPVTAEDSATGTERKVFFIEELQSDWHQQGRKYGYEDKEFDPVATSKEVERLQDKGERLAQKVLAQIEKDGDQYTADWFSGNDVFKTYRAIVENNDPSDAFMPNDLLEYTTEVNNLNEQDTSDTAEAILGSREMARVLRDKFVEASNEAGVHEELTEVAENIEARQKERARNARGAPDAPFKGDAWLNLSLKKAILRAVDEGYNSIAWPNAKVLADRWSDQFMSLYQTQYDKKMPSLVKKLTKSQPRLLSLEDGQPMPPGGGAEVFKSGYSSREKLLEQLQMDENLVSNPGADIESLELRSGLQIQQLGENNWNVLEDTEGLEGYWVIEITPELRERVQENGFPLFSRNEDRLEGMFDPETGQVYMVADNLTDQERAEWVAWHELFHRGVRASQMGSEADQLLKTLRSAGLNKTVKDLATAIMSDRRMDPEQRLVAVEEALAELNAADETGDYAAIERRYGITVPDGMRKGIRGHIARFVEAVRNVLAKITGRQADSILDTEVWRILQGAREGYDQPWMPAPVGTPGAAFSQAPDGYTETGAGRSQRAFWRNVASQPIDRLFRVPFDALGVVDSHGRFKPGKKLDEKARLTITQWQPNPDGKFAWMTPIVEKARAGLIDRYGLSEEFMQRAHEAESEERRRLGEVMDILKKFEDSGVSTSEARVIQAMLTGEQLPEGEWGKLAEPVRRAIDDMGQEMVNLGLLSPEAYERNKGTYLHRSYQKHEGEFTGLSSFVHKLSTASRRKIQGNALKRRGIEAKVTMKELRQDGPVDWWGTKMESGKADPALKGERFRVLEKVAPAGDGVATLEGVEEGGPRRRRVLRRVYWPADREVPASMKTWEDRGTWEVRSVQADKAVLWRDYTKSERERMGEILDARYNIAKTFEQLSHDLSVGRFMNDIASNPEWFQHEEPVGEEVIDAGTASRLELFTGVDWVRVPDAKIPATGTSKWGALAGGYVRAEIWRDLNEMDKMHQSGTWRKLMTQWKLNKTARSPVVHMNNVMSNLMFMDMADVRTPDLIRGLHSYVKQDQEYRDAQEHGAFGGTFVSHELRSQVLQPILNEIVRENVYGDNSVETKVGVLNKLAYGLWSGLKNADQTMTDVYQAEDEVFRMATYMRRRQMGDDPQTAGAIARSQFLDYDIRAPWVNAARRTVLPFISYTYRAIPVIAQSMAHRPWKLAKYYTLAHLAQVMAYSMAPGDEDEERRTMRERDSGYTWVGVPRKLRMPYRDDYGNPVFLDIRRWVPAGDVFDMNQGSSALPVPAPLQFGGPIMLGAEFMLNKQAFTGEKLMEPETDTVGDAAAEVGDWLWKSWMPSAAWIPNSWYWEKIGRAAQGGRDIKGRPYSVPQAVMSSVGIKLQPHDVELGYAFREMSLEKAKRKLEWDARQASDDLQRNIIDQDQYQEKMDQIREKMNRLKEKARELHGER